MAQAITQVIVVEGKTDAQKLQKIFGSQIKILITQGLRLDQKFLNFLEEVNNTTGLIIFTDPDFAGQKIRHQITNFLTNPVGQAFINRSDILLNSKKVGVAEASEDKIREALAKVSTFTSQRPLSLTWNDYLKNQFHLKAQRVKIATKLNWPPTLTGRTFFKWLNWSQKTVEVLQNLLEDD